MSTASLGAFAPDLARDQPRSDPALFRRARTWWLLLALFLLAQGNGLFTKQDDSFWRIKDVAQELESSSFYLFLTVSLWSLVIALSFAHRRIILRAMRAQKVLLSLVSLAILSSVWSTVPLLTFRRGIILLLEFVFAWQFARLYTAADQRRLLLTTGTITALSSVLMVVLLPQYGLSSAGEWKGIFSQKNQMGLSLVFLFSPLPFCRPARRSDLAKLLCAGMAIVLLVFLTQSRSAMILTVTIIAVRLLGPRITRMRAQQLPFWIFGIPFTILLVLLSRSYLLPLIGRSPTLTGRTENWRVLMPFVFRHIWLGYGFEGFWTGTGDSLDVWRSIGAGMIGADSGYIDTVLQLGLVGLGTVAAIFFLAARDCLRLAKRGAIPIAAYWYGSVVLAVFIGSFSEMLFLASSTVMAFVFILSCVGLHHLRRQTPTSSPSPRVQPRVRHYVTRTAQA